MYIWGILLSGDGFREEMTVEVRPTAEEDLIE